MCPPVEEVEAECTKEELICELEIGPDGEEIETCVCPELIVACAEEELICELRVGDDGVEAEVCVCPEDEDIEEGCAKEDLVCTIDVEGIEICICK